MWDELLQVDLLWRLQNLGQDVSGEDVWEAKWLRGIPTGGISPRQSGATLRPDATRSLVELVWFFQSAVVKFNDRRPVAEQINQLYFAVFQWRDPYIQQNKMVSFPGPLVSCQSCKAGFLLPNRSWRLIPGAPSPFCLGFSWLCSRLLILPNSPFSG